MQSHRQMLAQHCAAIASIRLQATAWSLLLGVSEKAVAWHRAQSGMRQLHLHCAAADSPKHGQTIINGCHHQCMPGGWMRGVPSLSLKWEVSCSAFLCKMHLPDTSACAHSGPKGRLRCRGCHLLCGVHMVACEAYIAH